MSRHNPIVGRVIALLEPVCQAEGIDLVDVRFASEPGGWVLRVCIDLLPASPELAVDGPRVDTGDLERWSREFSTILDVEDPIKQAYNLEVSSPGIDRGLRTPAHFRRFQGVEAKVQLAIPSAVAANKSAVAGASDRRNFRGLLGAVSEDGATVAINVDHVVYHLPIEDVESARVLPDWDAVMRGESGVVPGGPAPSRAPVKPPKPGALKKSQRKPHPKALAKSREDETA